MKKLTGSLAALALLSGCATIMEGAVQEVNFNPSPASGAVCMAQNERGTWRQEAGRRSVTLFRSVSDLRVRCEGNGYAGEAVYPSSMTPWAIGNIPWGIIPGFLVDASTGALFSYDDTITVPMALSGRVAATPAPAGSSYFCPALAPNGPHRHDDLVACGVIVKATDETRYLVMPKHQVK